MTTKKKKKKKGATSVPVNSLLSFFGKKGDAPDPVPAPAPTPVPRPFKTAHTPHSERWGWPGSASIFAPVPELSKTEGVSKKKRGFQKGNKAQTSAAANLARASTVAKRLKLVDVASASPSASALPAKRKRVEPNFFCPPPDSIRDHSVLRSNERALGTAALLKFASRDGKAVATAAAKAYKRKLKLARAGSVAFGPLDLMMFQRSAEKRFGEILPALLKDVPSSKGMLEHCKPVLDIVFAFVVKCFEEYEAKIASLHKKVAQLEKGKAAVINVVPNQDPYSSRTTLWRHAVSVKEVIRNHAGHCDVKAITLAHEVVKLLSTTTPSETAIEKKVNGAIVEAVQNFYYELKERHQGRHPKLVRSAWMSMNAVS